MADQEYWGQQGGGYDGAGQQYQPTQQYQPAQQYYQQGYQQPVQPVQQFYQPAEQPVSTGEWVLNLFLVALPIVGLVLLFVWAFGSSAPESKRNWARANLIWILVGIALAIAAGVIMTAMGISVYDAYRYSYR